MVILRILVVPFVLFVCMLLLLSRMVACRVAIVCMCVVYTIGVASCDNCVVAYSGNRYTPLSVLTLPVISIVC